VGSNIFNIFLIIGLCAVIRPLEATSLMDFDYWAFIGSVVLFWIFCLIGKQRDTVTRGEGTVMLLCMIAYYAVQVFNAAG